MDTNSNTETNSKIHENNKFITPLVTNVSYKDNYVLSLTFSDNSQKQIDFESYLKSATIYNRFLDLKKFKKVYLDYGDLSWKGNILDFHHSTLYNWKY